MCICAGELTGHGLSAAHSGHQLAGPLGSALSMGASAPVQSSADFLKETMHEVSWAAALGFCFWGLWLQHSLSQGLRLGD